MRLRHRKFRGPRFGLEKCFTMKEGLEGWMMRYHLGSMLDGEKGYIKVIMKGDSGFRMLCQSKNDGCG